MQRKISAFRELTHADLQKINDMKTCVAFKKGQVVLHEGARAQGVYCIHKGNLKFYKMNADGKEQILRFAMAGDLIGYRSLLSDEAIRVSVAALEDVHACYIPKASFFEIIHSNPKFSLNILEASCKELGEAGRVIASLAQKSVRERLAEVLLILNATFQQDADGNINLQLSREELASMIGTATESAIRLLSEFKEDKFVETSGRKIKILNNAALRKVANLYE